MPLGTTQIRNEENMGKQGVSETSAILDPVDNCIPQVLMLQELDLIQASQQLCAGLEATKLRVCFIKRPGAAHCHHMPIRRAATPEVMDADRAAFACCEFESDGVVQKFVVGSVDGHSEPGDADLASCSGFCPRYRPPMDHHGRFQF